MRAVLIGVVLFLLFSCGDNVRDPALDISGTWEYTHGDGRYFCNDGQAGHLSVDAGKVATITREDNDPERVRVFYEGACPSGFGFALGDEQPEEGWLSQGDICEYDASNSFGDYHTTLTNTSDSSLFLNDARDTLTDKVEHVYVFAYEDFTQVCSVFSVGYAKRAGVH